MPSAPHRDDGDLAASRTFTPLHHPLIGTLHVPGDKSISHRSVLFASMAEGVSHVSGLLDSLDVRSSIAAARALGAAIETSPDASGSLDATIDGWGRRGPASPTQPIDCGNSGTTTRLLMGLLAGYDVEATLCGDASLMRRPMARVTTPLSLMGASFVTDDGHLPVRVRGRKTLSPIEYATPVASAQVKTAILLAALHADGTTRVTEPSRSRDHTERMLPAFGCDVHTDGLTVCVTGPTSLVSCDIAVPGDPSSAAFLLAAAACVPGSSVTVADVSLNETRTAFLKVMRRMGAHVRILKTGSVGSEPVGDITVIGDSELRGTVVPSDEIPALIDEIPILALLATTAKGTTCFLQAGELRVKESDRLAAIIDGLTALGCNAWAKGDDLYIEGGKPERSATIPSQGDHRLAMCWALAGMLFDCEVTVDDTACMAVSYPGFLDDVGSLS